MFKQGSETMEGMDAGAAAPAYDESGVGSLLSELSGVYQEVQEPEASEPEAQELHALAPELAAPEVSGPEFSVSEFSVSEFSVEAEERDSENLLNQLSGVVEQPVVESEQAPEPVAGKEPEMSSPPRVEPPSFFWKPQRRGFLRRKK
jgi:hypothetical protein